MSLKEKLDGVFWDIGFPVIGYLACSGMDSLSKRISYKESLSHPFTVTKFVLYGIVALAFLETYVAKDKK